MKNFILTLILVAIISISVFASVPPVNPGTLPAISWEDAGSNYEIVYEDAEGQFTIIEINGKLFVVYN